MAEVFGTYLALAIAGGFVLYKTFIRLRLSRAKHPSLRGHARWSRRMARLVTFYAFDAQRFFCCDGAPASVVRQRREGIERLRAHIGAQMPRSLACSGSLEDSLSDLRFTSAYRVPFPFRTLLPREFKLGSVVDRTDGVRVRDIDGNWRYDLSGSYGVNVFGYDFYKSCIDEGCDRVRALGPVLGPYHPLIRDNVARLRTVSGQEEVSFHMSGTEAVMQAVRLARYHTGRSHLVRFCGAYHGWWDGVQPGIGNRRRVDDVYTLNDTSPHTLRVLATRKDIACVLVNPLQALNPNADAPGDATLVDSRRTAHFDKATYTRWLKALREVCTRRGIVLIFDEVLTGFRLARGGAQEYFGVRADMVTYGKTLGGGLPVGVLCGRHDLMKRFRDDHPVDISFARGTFNSHPYVLGAMSVFLERVEQAEYAALYRNAEALWDRRFGMLNARLAQADVPIRVASLHTVCTILYTTPSRYNWMLQFYLRANGLELSWVGSGRFIMSLNYSDEDFEAVVQRIVEAAKRMQQDGWWWHSEALTNQSIQKQLMREMLAARFPCLERWCRPSSALPVSADDPIQGAPQP